LNFIFSYSSISTNTLDNTLYICICICMYACACVRVPTRLRDICGLYHHLHHPRPPPFAARPCPRASRPLVAAHRLSLRTRSLCAARQFFTAQSAQLIPWILVQSCEAESHCPAVMCHLWLTLLHALFFSVFSVLLSLLCFTGTLCSCCSGGDVLLLRYAAMVLY